MDFCTLGCVFVETSEGRKEEEE
ncbi:uncharacterized protein [Blastocystis hominis]|uniref:Uncharacterized protein n=1 Tax=Blastocystis hominis TaxID=12968 RepID=D8M8B2_BLAHO|nr:uncharacterized protein [Blastocystis hominis]CBK24301.2 unnamed protein product [Blastocystis hominis]|eukprot:XP_012898349.1 uncharacterized protein [Blastocystis hominis]